MATFLFNGEFDMLPVVNLMMQLLGVKQKQLSRVHYSNWESLFVTFEYRQPIPSVSVMSLTVRQQQHCVRLWIRWYRWCASNSITWRVERTTRVHFFIVIFSPSKANPFSHNYWQVKVWEIPVMARQFNERHGTYNMSGLPPPTA